MADAPPAYHPHKRTAVIDGYPNHDEPVNRLDGCAGSLCPDCGCCMHCQQTPMSSECHCHDTGCGCSL